MDWTKEDVVKFIKLYEKETVLWDVDNIKHKNSNCRSDAFNTIAAAMNRPVLDVQRKLHSLRSQYLREKSKIIKSKKSGAGVKDVYRSKWYCFKLLSFLSSGDELMEYIHSSNISLEHKNSSNVSMGHTNSSNIPVGHTNSSNIPVERTNSSNIPVEHTNSSNIQMERTNSSNIPVEPTNSSNIPVQHTNSSSIQMEHTSSLNSDLSAMEKKFNETYNVFRGSMNMKKDEDSCFGEYIAEALKQIKDRKLKSWVRHSITNILFQAECGTLAYPQNITNAIPVPQ